MATQVLSILFCSRRVLAIDSVLNESRYQVTWSPNRMADVLVLWRDF